MATRRSLIASILSPRATSPAIRACACESIARTGRGAAALTRPRRIIINIVAWSPNLTAIKISSASTPAMPITRVMPA